MDEHSQCSAQAVQYHDSEHGPIKVMYFWSRKDLENVGQKFLTRGAEEEQSTVNAPYYTLPEETPNHTSLSIPHATRPATDGNATNPVSFGASEVPDSDNLIKVLRGHAFDDDEKYRSIGNEQKKEEKKKQKKQPFIHRLKDFLFKPSKPQQIIPSNDHEPTPSPIYYNYIDDEYELYYPRYQGYKYALVFDVATEFNPSGIWVIEEFYNDEDKLEY